MRTGTVRIAQEFLCRLIGFPEGTRILGARNAQERDPDGLVDVVEVLVASDQLPNWPGENPPLLSPTFRRDSAAELPTLVSWGQAERHMIFQVRARRRGSPSSANAGRTHRKTVAPLPGPSFPSPRPLYRARPASGRGRGKSSER